MCGVSNCPLAFREILNLRQLVAELSEDGRIDLLQTLQPVALVILDMCAVLALDPGEVLGSEMMGRIDRRGDTRLWPTLTAAEDAEMVELDNIRQMDLSDRDTPISTGDIDAMYHRNWPAHQTFGD
jgi:hypothetical protein